MRANNPNDKREEHDELVRKMAEAIDDSQEYDRLDAVLKALVTFRPCMTHSFGENAKTVVFHVQLLTDFNTVEELGRKMLQELEGISEVVK